MVYRSKNGFTLIELVMVIAIIAIIAVPSAWIMVYIVQNSIFIPNQLNMDMIAQEALEIMIEGDGRAKGLRFCRQVSSLAAAQIDFINQNNLVICYRLDTTANKLYRSIGGSAEELIPYYVVSGINLSGKSGALFTYYDATDSTTNVPADVRRIRITLIARSGTGSYSDWQGQSEESSSIAVHKF